MTDLQVFVRNAELKRVGQLDQFQSAEVIRRHQDVGAWSLVCDADDDLVSELVTDGAGLEIIRNGTPLISGPIWHRTRNRTGEANTLELSGPDDGHVVFDRLVHPQPGSSAPPYSSSAYDIRTGVASTIIRQFVDVNCGPSATSARRVSGLSLADDPLVGSTITGTGRWQNLGEFIRALAQTNDLGFEVITTEAAGIEFRVWEPVDLSGSVQFSLGLGNLGDYSFSEDAPTGNYGFGLGQGEGTARAVVESNDSASVARWGRIEFVQDRRDTATAAEISQSLREALTEQASQRALQFEPLDIAGLSFGDYGIGDIVTVVVEGVTLQEIVREVTLTYDEIGETVKPVIGDAEATDPDTPSFFSNMRHTNRVVRDLVRR